MQMLEITDLVVKYDSIAAVKGVSLRVEQGEMVSLIGANGAGKTTILKTISGLLKASSGKIQFEDTDITNAATNVIVGKGVVQVPEGRQIFSKMTIEENLRLGSYIQKDRAKNAQNMEHVMELFPRLKERFRQLAGTLSGGEQQMLAIGRALMTEPRLLLLDEPSMGLSPLMTQQVFEVLASLKKEGITMLLVEQNAYDALEISDRAYILETGLVTKEGPSHDLIQDPAVKEAYLGGD